MFCEGVVECLAVCEWEIRGLISMDVESHCVLARACGREAAEEEWVECVAGECLE